MDVSATDANVGQTLTYSWDVTDAALGLALDTATGMITGTPLKVYNMSHTVTVTDGTAEATHTIQVTIAAAPTDTTSPTVAITVLSKDVNGKHTLDTAGTVRFRLLFSEPLAKAPSVSRLQTTDFTVTNHLGVAVPAANVSLSAAKAEAGGKESYTLTVTAGTDPQEVKIALDGRQVTDLATPTGNTLIDPTTMTTSGPSLMSKFDTIPPTVVITPGYFNAAGKFVAAITGEPMAKLAVRICV